MTMARQFQIILITVSIVLPPQFVANEFSFSNEQGFLKKNLRLEDMIITASRESRNKHTIPANVTVISADNIAQSTAQNVPDLIKFYSGIQVVDITGNGRKTNVDVRGFGETASANTLAMVDGRRINGSDLSGVDWTTVPLERIERIEIVRGGNGVLYGDKAVGGVVNIITKKGSTADHHFIIGGNSGSYKMVNPWFDFSGSQMDGSLSYSINGSYFDTDGFRDNGFLRNKTTGFGINYDDGRFLLELSGGVKDDRYGLPGSIPENVDPKSTNTPNDFAESEEYYLHVVPGFRFAEIGQIQIAIDYRRSEQFSFFKDIDIIEFDIHELGISPQLDIQFRLLGIKNRFKTGADIFNSELEKKGSFGNNDERGSYAFYLHNVAAISENVYFDFGYRYDRIEYDFENFEETNHNINVGNVGLTWNYAEASKVFLSYDRSYRTQLLDELGGPSFNEPLDPQTSNQLQLGISHSTPIGLQSSLTLFQIDSKDEILFDSNLVTPGAVFPGQNVNYEKTHRFGVEFDLNQNLGKIATFFANFTLMETELDRGPYDQKRIPGVPHLHGSFGMKLFPIKFVTLDIRSRWVKNKILISDWENNVNWNDSYFVTDAKVSFDWNIAAFYVGVNNLFDEEYSEFGTFNSAVAVLPSPDRNFIAGIKLSINF